MYALDCDLGREQEAHYQADESQSFDEGDTNEHVRRELAGQFRLAGDGVLGVTDQDTQADARANRGQTVTDSCKYCQTSSHVFLSLFVVFPSPVDDGSSVGVYGEVHIHRGQDRKNIGLQESHQDFEQGEGERSREGEHADG